MRSSRRISCEDFAREELTLRLSCELDNTSSVDDRRLFKAASKYIELPLFVEARAKLSGLDRSLDDGRSGDRLRSNDRDRMDAVADVSTLGHTVLESLPELDIVMVVLTTIACVCNWEALNARCSSKDSCMMFRISSGSSPLTYPSSSGISFSCHELSFKLSTLLW